MSFYQARRAVVSTCLELADKGYLAGTGGNVACRINDDYFAITPSATDYYSMSPDDICVLRLDDLVHIAGDRAPSVELRLHAHVLRVRRDCDASIHTHQPIASAYTLLGRELEVTEPEHRAILGPKAALVNYAPSGTSWLASKLGNTLRPGIHAYFLRNHGVVCCGPTLSETVIRVETLEAACASFFRNAIHKQECDDCESTSREALTLLANFGKMETAQ
jgi:L-fuculose-phosphate aldolase